MGGKQSKITDPAANIVNEIEVNQEMANFALIETTLVIISVLMCLSVALKLYSMHNKMLKRKYLNRINSVEKI